MEFDANGFMAYMKSQFSPMDSQFTYGLVENVVIMGMEKYPDDPEKLSLFLVGLVPELREDEVMKFWKPGAPACRDIGKEKSQCQPCQTPLRP